MEPLKKNLASLLEKAIGDGIFPSYAVGICLYKKNSDKECLHLSGSAQSKIRQAGESGDKYFDLASLTKPFVTALSIISLVGEGKINLADRMEKYLPVSLSADKRQITISQLLSHSSGLPAHLPYFTTLATFPSENRKREMLRLILSTDQAAKPGTTAIYSDLGYLLLGMIIEALTGVSLAQYFSEKIAGPLGLAEDIFFQPLGSSKRERECFAPTEYCPWRGRVLRGEVSDENCWVLGGVAGHAGLFGNIEAVLGLTGAILEIWQGSRVHPHIRQEDLALFLETPSPVVGSSWVMGFDRPTPGSSSSGKYLSPRSVGHLGFTGTSFWLDPDKGLVVVLLTNRVHPSRDNVLLREFRPLFHDRVVELLGLV